MTTHVILHRDDTKLRVVKRWTFPVGVGYSTGHNIKYIDLFEAVDI